jgi:hypothetical protein
VDVQAIIDRAMEYLTGPTGWVAIVAAVGIGLFMMRGNPAR